MFSTRSHSGEPASQTQNCAVHLYITCREIVDFQYTPRACPLPTDPKLRNPFDIHTTVAQNILICKSQFAALHINLTYRFFFVGLYGFFFTNLMEEQCVIKCITLNILPEKDVWGMFFFFFFMSDQCKDLSNTSARKKNAVLVYA